ncbi:hypothetical protein GPJ56_000293 [Histomonas meleagridis]|uniref:uncharacterized protein n=1 Tax=Histomonas meleagridis TaxID=135588 RepID=UPI00355A6BB3|nr:hypothetical protein GPJ56_000293 [Histomonas meleagridis]KAH0806811.1 hypothetical protein GO595_000454 [Histomonas meleagridis]
MPNETLKLSLSASNNVLYKSFNPIKWLGPNADLQQIWHALLSNKGILVYGSNAYHVSNAIFSILSLASPVRYVEDYLIYTRLGDPRFAEVIEGSRKYKVVGTTNILALERCNQFEVTIILPERVQNPNKNSSNEIRNKIEKRETRLLGKVLDIIDRKLETDPYFSLLLKEFSVVDLYNLQPKKKESKKLKFEEILDFMKTKTFISWRKKVVFRSTLRDGFLSTPPDKAINENNPIVLKKMLKMVKYLINKNKEDLHFIAVLKKHKHILKQMIKNKNIHAE